MTKSKNGIFTSDIVCFTAETFTMIVMESTFLLLPLDQVSIAGNTNFVFPASFRNVDSI